MRDKPKKQRPGGDCKIIVFLLLVILGGLNAALLLRGTALRRQLGLQRDSRVRLTIEEQLSILKHEIQGEDLRKRIDQLMLDPDSARILVRGEPMLLYIIKAVTCDRCLYNEIMIFKEFSHAFARQNLNVAFLFSDISAEDFRHLVNSLGIADIAFRERKPVLTERFSGISQPMTLFISNGGIVFSANISNFFRDPDRTRRYLQKIMRLVPHQQGPFEEPGRHP